MNRDVLEKHISNKEQITQNISFGFQYFSKLMTMIAKKTHTPTNL